jgi:hypothetical protein
VNRPLVSHLCYTDAMPAKNPRVNTVLETPLFRVVQRLAKNDGVSLSEKVRDLVREAVELVEDEGLEALARTRRELRPKAKLLTHAEVKRRLNLR